MKIREKFFFLYENARTTSATHSIHICLSSVKIKKLFSYFFSRQFSLFSAPCKNLVEHKFPYHIQSPRKLASSSSSWQGVEYPIYKMQYSMYNRELCSTQFNNIEYGSHRIRIELEDKAKVSVWGTESLPR